MKTALFPLFLALFLLSALPANAGEEGVHVSLIQDEDGDDAILMESEWISMHLLPWRQALINRFVFTPTGNDIVETTNPKVRQTGGGGLLMDCLWEQDWRFQELGFKPYKYTVVKNGPDEAQVAFETNIVGWLGSDNSGTISKLLSDLTLKRTVTIKSGQPFFRFDFEFINNGLNAKRPTFWVHNSSHIGSSDKKESYFGIEASDTMIRPSARGLSAIGPDQDSYPAIPKGESFIRDFNTGWSANINAKRKEGIVYLMDYDCVDSLYNCGNMTTEWFYDGILVPKSKPWRGRLYILPIIGLSHVNFANEYFIVALDPKREGSKLSLDIQATASYEKAAQVNFSIEVEHDLLTAKNQVKTMPKVAIDNLAIQPSKGHSEMELDATDPLIFDITAVVDMPDGTAKKFYFQHFYTGEHKNKGNERDVAGSGGPVKLLDRAVRKPALPEVPANLAINRKDFNVFGIFGLGTYKLGLDKAIATIPNAKLEIGYCNGSDPAQNGLSDFPYDYDRLFNYRVLTFSGIQDKEFRRIGASILLPWLKAGGGLVVNGGLYAFTFEHESHEINEYYPIKPSAHNIVKGPVQLQHPIDKDHPIFRGVDLSNLPWLHFYHNIGLKPGIDAKVLMKVGDAPFIVEKRTGNQITMVVASTPFGDESLFPGKPLLYSWKEWPKLYANIVRYAAGDLK